jgi:hypothetical protein
LTVAAEDPAVVLARLHRQFLELKAARAAARAALALVDRDLPELEPAPTPPLVPLASLPGYAALDARAAAAYTPQDAKLLSSRWGISTAEIKYICAQYVLLSPGGALDCRLSAFLVNRLGYLSVCDDLVSTQPRGT